MLNLKKQLNNKKSPENFRTLNLFFKKNCYYFFFAAAFLGAAFFAAAFLGAAFFAVAMFLEFNC